MKSTTLLTTVLTALALSTTACSLPFEREPAAAQAPAAASVDSVDAPAGSAVSAQEQGQPGTASVAPPTSTHELRYVSPEAPACSAVWVAGAQLPLNYEWCRDEDGEPVAGVRIGSCEVITYRNSMYAVPGRRVMTTIGEIHLDQQFAQLLTSCKRQPYVR